MNVAAVGNRIETPSRGAHIKSAQRAYRVSESHSPRPAGQGM